MHLHGQHVPVDTWLCQQLLTRDLFFALQPSPLGPYQCICQPCVPPMPVGGAAFGGLGKAGFAGLVLALLLLVSLLVYVLLFHRPAEWMPPLIPYAKLHLVRHPELLGRSRTGRVLKGRYRGSAVVSEVQSDLCMLQGRGFKDISAREACKAQRLAAGRSVWRHMGQILFAVRWCKVASAACRLQPGQGLCQAWPATAEL